MEINMRLQVVDMNQDFEKWNAIIINSPDFYTIAHNPSLIGFLHKKLNVSISRIY